MTFQCNCNYYTVNIGLLLQIKCFIVHSVILMSSYCAVGRQPSFNSVETDGRSRAPYHVSQKPPRFQGKLLNGQSQMISSQLSSYDDDSSPTTETPSPVTEVQSITNHQSNGPQQNSVSNIRLPVTNVPVKVKENILKV